jgi:hypothetical protein
MEYKVIRENNFNDVSVREKNYKRLKILNSLFFLLMALNLGLSNIAPGYLYLYTSTKNAISLIYAIIMIVGIIFLFNSTIIIDKNLFILQSLYFFSTFLTSLINVKFIEDIFYSLFLAIIPLLLCILAIALTRKADGFKFTQVLISIYSIWLSLQTIFAALNLYISNGVVNKNLLIVSIGGSNFIAAHLIVCFIYIVLSYRSHFWKFYFLIIGILLFAIILTASFGAILTIIMMLSFSIIFHKKNRSLKLKIITIIILVLLLFLILGELQGWIFQIMDTNNILYIPLYKLSIKLKYLMEKNYARAFAGRFEIYNLAIQSVLKKPLFGHLGYLKYNNLDVRTHNWILDSLIFRGVIGTFFYSSSIIYLMLKIHNQSKENNNLRSIKYALYTGIFHGMIEPNFFTRTFDFLWWLMAGIAIGEIIKLNRNIRIGYSIKS